jgi:hypothetical protein
MPWDCHLGSPHALDVEEGPGGGSCGGYTRSITDESSGGSNSSLSLSGSFSSSSSGYFGGRTGGPGWGWYRSAGCTSAIGVLEALEADALVFFAAAAVSALLLTFFKARVASAELFLMCAILSMDQPV